MGEPGFKDAIAEGVSRRLDVEIQDIPDIKKISNTIWDFAHRDEILEQTKFPDGKLHIPDTDPLLWFKNWTDYLFNRIANTKKIHVLTRTSMNKTDGYEYRVL